MGSICMFFEDKPVPVNSRQTGGKGASLGKEPGGVATIKDEGEDWEKR